MKNPVVVALEKFLSKEITYSFDGRQKAANIVNEAVPLAKEQAEKAEALEWLIRNFVSDNDRHNINQLIDRPSILKTMLKEQKRGKHERK